MREQGTVIGYQGNRFEVREKGIVVSSTPAEPLEMIEVFGNVQMTTQCMTECLKRGITVVFYSTYGAYFWKTDIYESRECQTTASTGGTRTG